MNPENRFYYFSVIKGIFLALFIWAVIFICVVKISHADCSTPDCNHEFSIRKDEPYIKPTPKVHVDRSILQSGQENQDETVLISKPRPQIEPVPASQEDNEEVYNKETSQDEPIIINSTFCDDSQEDCDK